MWKLNTFSHITYQDFQIQIHHALQGNERQRYAIWGAGVRGMMAGMLLEKAGVTDFCFIDSAVERIGSQIAGHEVKAFDQINDTNVYIFISMEYQQEVVEKLQACGLKEERDYFCLRSQGNEFFVKQLRDCRDLDVLVLGDSCVCNIPFDEMEQMSLMQMLEKRIEGKSKILGMPSIGMRNLYRVFQIESEKNKHLKKIVLLINWRNITSYNHLLPRTQKTGLIEEMIRYTQELGYNEIESLLEDDLKTALERIGNYNLENQYSPQNVVSDLDEDTRISYLKISDLEELDKEAEEYVYLEKLLKAAYLKKIKVYLIVEPYNYELIVDLLGECALKIYEENYRFLSELAARYEAKVADAGRLLGEEDFLATRTVGDALRMDGRKRFAEFVADTIRNEEKND